MLNKLAQGFTKLLAEVRELSATVQNMPTPKDGKQGKAGAAGLSPSAESVAELVLAKIPTPKDGEAGQDADVNAIIKEVLAKIPTPKDGKPGQDAKPPLLADVAALVLAQIPKPKDGETPDPKALAAAAAALIPKPKDGVSPSVKAVAALVKVPVAKQGKTGKAGASITDVKLERNILSVWIDGVKKHIGKIEPAAQPAFSSGGAGSLVPPRSDAAGVDPNYFPGKTVKKNTIVNDAGWLMSSLVGTSQRAAVQPTGDPFFIYQGTPVGDSALAKQVILGQRYTFNDGGGYLRGYKVNTTVGNHYEVFTVRDPEGAAQITQVLTFTATTTGDQSFGLTPQVVPQGTAVDLLVMIREPNPTPTTFDGDWDYKTPKKPENPGTGEVIQPDENLGLISISKTDAMAGDRSAELEALAAGDVISRGGVSWAIQATVDQGDFIAFAVAPSLQSQPDGVQTITFETTTPTPISYQRDDGYWASNDNIQGLFIVDGPYDQIVPDDNAYGIVDIEVQDAEVPTDWHFLAVSGDVSGGSSSSNVRLDVLGSYSTIVAQTPTGTGTAGIIRINFGVGGTTTGGEFTIASDGLITCHQNSIEYDFNVLFRIARSGGQGVAEIVGRMMYAPDGVEANAVQAEDSFVVRIDDADTVWREQIGLKFSPAVGSVIWFELTRNPGANNSGQLSTVQPAGDISDWNTASVARLNIGKLVTF